MHQARCASRFAISITLLAATARADVETAVYFNDQLFAYEIVHMPDLDQWRGTKLGVPGLPNDGKVHCAPTSTLNLMIYCANHGFPEVWPGPGNYQDGLYDVATLNDLALGIAMSTDLPNGTSGTALFDGTRSWLTSSAPGRFTVTAYAASYKYAPRLTSLAKSAIGGSVVSICYGRYTVTGTYLGLDVLARDGGHCVTLSRALRNGDEQLLAVRDPADSGDSAYLQSDFGNREVEVTDRQVAVALSPNHVRTMSSISYDVAKEKNAYIDRYISIKPKQGYSWQPSPSTFTTAFAVHHSAHFHGGTTSGSEQVYAIAGVILDAVIAPDQTSMALLVVPKAGSPAELQELDLLDGMVSKIATVPGASSLHFSRHRTLYVAAPGLITLVDLDEKKADGSVLPQYPVSAIAYDDKADELVVLCADAKKLLRWGEGLGAEPRVFDLSNLVMGGASTITIDPTDGEVFFATEKSPQIFGVVDDGTIIPCIAPWDLAGAPFPTALDFDDIGHLFAVAGGKTFEFEYAAATGWSSVAGSPFAGLAVGKGFRVTRSRNNIDPTTMPATEWRDLDPNSISDLVDGPFVPDCDGSPANLEYGAGKPGGFGTPQLVALDLPTLGKETAIRLENGRPGAMPLLLLGSQQAALPFDGGVLHLVPSIVIPIPVPIAADGTLTLSGTLPGDANLCGVTLHHQMMFVDPGAAGFHQLAFTNGLARTLGS
jgi:hypothetical protein